MQAGMGVLPVSATGACLIAKRRSCPQFALALENRRGAQVALIANESFVYSPGIFDENLIARAWAVRVTA